MISQVVTLLGVLAGALTSYFVTSASERARHRRAMDTRWDERKLNTYVEYASVVKEAHRAAKAAFQARQTPDEAVALLAEMDDAESRRSVLFETLILLAEPSAITAANAVNGRLWDALRLARRQQGEDSDWDSVGAGLIAALGEFHGRARSDLGIAGALSPAT
ncbi:hypothetical protein [Kitasatospora sp. NPDC002040]|uniref:hypothetical protein n=1 Tax=Kitasatospora sp. NPDC002040 TaxID=3154661 RepID=UPI00332D63A2